MRLYVMRHGPAEDRAPSGRDADRALTPEGRARVERVAAALRAVHAATPPSAPDPAPRILASPLRRARETAEIVAGVLLGGAGEIDLHDDLSLDADPPVALASRIGREGADAILIGHQPNVEDVRALARAAPGRGPSALRGGFCTAMVVVLELAAPDIKLGWDVRHVIDPRLLP